VLLRACYFVKKPPFSQFDDRALLAASVSRRANDRAARRVALAYSSYVASDTKAT
jgi:hypothetical protein